MCGINLHFFIKCCLVGSVCAHVCGWGVFEFERVQVGGGTLEIVKVGRWALSIFGVFIE